jgi:iron complex transport system substrate-binding protein
MRTPRMLVAAVPLLVGALLSASCSAEEPSSASEPDPAAASGGPVDGTFPATVPHKFGETTVPEQPVRVVSVGVTEQDILLQLGVVPVAVTEWYGDKPFATWPWAEDLLGDAEPEVLSTDDGPT